MDENNQEIQETEVILTQEAVEQLIQNIKNADNEKISKSVLSGAYDILYSSAANTPARLAANTTITKKFLSMQGAGDNMGAAPAWNTVTQSDVGLGNVENTKLSTWAGSNKITTVGTLSSGTVPWARLSDVPTATNGNNATLGLVKIGDNININDGTISVSTATSNTLGLVSIGNNININNGEISVSTASISTTGVVKLSSTTGSNAENVAATSKAVQDTYNQISTYAQPKHSATSITLIFNNNTETTASCDKVTTGNDIIISPVANDLIQTSKSYNKTSDTAPQSGIIYYTITTTAVVDLPTFDSNTDYYILDNNNYNMVVNTKVLPVSGTTYYTITATTFNGAFAENTNYYTENKEIMSSWEIWRDSGIRCTEQSNNQLTFKADEEVFLDTRFNAIIFD